MDLVVFRLAVSAWLPTTIGLVLCATLVGCTSPLPEGAENMAAGTATSAQGEPSASPSHSSSLQPTVSQPLATQAPATATPVSATTPVSSLPSGDYVVYCTKDMQSGDGGSPSSFLFSTAEGNIVGGVPVAYCNNVSLSPTARYLAVGDEYGGVSGIHTVELATGEMRQLQDSIDCEKPVWSPDELWVVAECVNLEFRFLRVDGSQDSISFNWFDQRIGGCRSPRWSPNGDWIAFGCDYAPLPSGMGYALSVSCLNASVDCPGELIWLGPIFAPLAWSPHSDFIMATWVPDLRDPAKGPPVFAVFDAAGDGGQPLQVLNQPETAIGVSSAAWSPNAKTLAYTRRTSPGVGWMEVRLVPLEGGESAIIAVGLLGEGDYLSWLTVP